MTREFKNKVREQFGRAADGYIHDKGFSTGDDLETMAEAIGSGQYSYFTAHTHVAYREIMSRNESGFAKLTERIAQSGVEFTGIELHKESLEDIFMRIMEGETDVS